MEPPQVDLWYVAQAKLAGAAFCGGVVRLLFRPAQGETVLARMLKSAWLLFGCVTCGFFFTPPMMSWWGFDPSYSGAIGAVLGFVGLSVADGVLRSVDGFNLAGVLRFMLKSEGK